jgi:hypothetical protein
LSSSKPLGYWQCAKCKSKDVYISEETSGAYAMTLNTPGPVDPTIINTISSNVTRCNNCNSRAIWVLTEAGQQRNAKLSMQISFVAGVIFFLAPFVAQIVTGLSFPEIWIGSLIASAFFFFVGWGAKTSLAATNPKAKK